MLAGLDVKRDDEADLLGTAVVERRRPGRLLPDDVVRGLLVREEDVAIEALLPGRQEVGAEALEALAAVDRERAAQDPAECWLSTRRLTWALSKSFSPFAAAGAAVLYGNGTLLVSWLM